MDNLVVNAVAPWEGYLHWSGVSRRGTGKTGSEWAFIDFTLRYSDHKMQEKYITFSASNPELVSKIEDLKTGTPLRVQWLPDTAYDDKRDKWYPQFKAFNVSVIEDVAKQEKQAKEKITRPDYPQAQPSREEAWKNPMKASEDRSYTPDDTDLPFN